MPPKKQSAASPPKKGSSPPKKPGAGKNAAKVAPSCTTPTAPHPPSIPEAPAAAPAAPLPLDPWRAVKSPYGGKLSPFDEWSRVVSGYDTRKELVLTCSNFPTAGHGDVGVALAALADTTVSSFDSLRVSSCYFKTLSFPSDVLPTLITLDVSSNSLNAESLKAALSCSPLTFLRVLVLAGNRLSSLPAFSFFASATPKLLSLDLSHNPLGGSLSSSSFDALPLSGTLLCLSLENSDLGGQPKLLSDVLAPLTNLRHLNVEHSGLPDDAFKTLSSSSSASGSDSASGVSSSSLGLAACPPPPFMKKLESLHAGARADVLLPFLHQLPCLKSLCGVPYCASMTLVNVEEGLQLMRLDDPMVKDSSTCSCIYGNVCTDKYNCYPWIWHRRFEIARRAKEDPDFDPDKFRKAVTAI